MREIDRILNHCTECGLCADECDFLKKCGVSPRELADRYSRDGLADSPEIPYSCNICSLCRHRCPEDLDVGKMVLEMRVEMVSQGRGPLPQHAPVRDAQEFYVSDAFKVAIPSLDQKTERVFFPGCALSAYSPGLVTKTYEYLKTKLPGTGILLGCCGGPAYLIGAGQTFEHISTDMAAAVKGLGASQVIAACPFCHSLLKQHHPELNPVSLYAVLGEIGIPELKQKALSYSIHDPCSARLEPGIHASVRSIVRKAGHEVVEIPHIKAESHCCGMGGMVYVADAELGRLRSRRTLDEADKTIITYCATCRETLQGQGGHVIHLLDLLFNPRWKRASLSAPRTPEVATNNMKQVRKTLLKNKLKH